jgi:hypothetical protein
MHAMRLYLINPSYPLVSIVKIRESRWNRYRLWKPLSLMVLAGLAPREWKISIVDENLVAPDYRAMPRPDLVGITAFTSQANRAYEVASYFHHLGVPIIMGGIHATMCLDEAMEQRGATARAADHLCGQSLIQAQQSLILQGIRGLQGSTGQ